MQQHESSDDKNDQSSVTSNYMSCRNYDEEEDLQTPENSASNT